jgi:hypothetical protein
MCRNTGPIKFKIMKDKKSPRQEIAQFANDGSLRGLLEISAIGLSDEAINLLVDIVLRYCEPRKPTKNRGHV